jgi:hypothetical protein
MKRATGKIAHIRKASKLLSKAADEMSKAKGATTKRRRRAKTAKRRTRRKTPRRTKSGRFAKR